MGSLLKTLQIDRATGGLVLLGGVPQFLEGPDAKVQQVEIRFKTVQGEFFLDRTLGVPYYEEILKKGANPRVIIGIFTTILQNLGLVDVTMDLSYDGPTRKATGFFRAVDPNGGQVSGSIS